MLNSSTVSSVSGQATRIRLLDFTSAPMRAFHMAWLAFFSCFFAWFGIAPLMQVVRGEMHLTDQQVGWCIVGSVAVTIVGRVAAGWCCDRIGPRITFTALLLVGALPVMGIGLAHDFSTFFVFRVLIGVIGASFVVTQYHTARMFAPNCVGTANALAAGWGNLGGGVTQLAMPLLFGLLVDSLGFSAAAGWRLAMLAAGVVCVLTGIAYFFLTQDTPQGNFRELRATGGVPASSRSRGSLWTAGCDPRVWALAAVYGACFGIELTIDNIGVLYFLDYFDHFQEINPAQALRQAGAIVALFGMMNLFARALGGWISDGFGNRWGLSARVKWLFLAVFCEGIGLMLFSQATTLAAAVPLLLAFALFVKMSNGATFAVVPFVNRTALGAVSGIVGAGGNAFAVAAGFLFTIQGLDWHTVLFVLGSAVTTISFVVLSVKFSPVADQNAAAAAVDPSFAAPVELAQTV